MNLYPALQAMMGDWKYYIVKMTMRELAKEVSFASEVYDDRTLDEAIQRVLNEGRAKKEIVTFLQRRQDRFFASIVVAALGGSPRFYPVRITDDPQFQLFVDAKIDQAFGVLTFDGGQKYYALDGQHRLKAIKTLLDPSDPLSHDTPEGFEREEMSVLIVLKREEDDNQEFMKRYRRLFSSLNRYAKPTDRDTNIIMDEDDAFAILTRRLITEHEFFQSPRRQRESTRVLTKGKNLRTSDPQFTSLQTLYEMNKWLLWSAWRRSEGWGGATEREQDINSFIRFRPDEDYLEVLYDELVTYWNAILEVLPSLRNDPLKMRVHDAKDDSGTIDHLLFWPIGQELFARLIRRLMDRRLPDPKKPTKETVKRVIMSVQNVEWRLHQPPWRHFLLVGDGSPRMPWRMRDEDRAKALEIAERLLAWLVGLDDLDEDDVEELKIDWQTRLSPLQEVKSVESMWETILKLRSRVMAPMI